MLKVVLLLAASALAQQTYENRFLNTIYTAPAGWALEVPDTSAFGEVTLKATRVGLAPVIMRAAKLTNNEAGYLSASSETFYRLHRLYNGTTSTQAPVLTFIQDTTMGSLHYASIVAKQVDLNIAIVEYAVSNQNYLHTFIYTTTLQDYTTNGALYAENWLKFLFISLDGAPTLKMSSGGMGSQVASNAAFFDLLGRSVGSGIEVRPDRTHRISYPQK
jgi:hypothetical protein